MYPESPQSDHRGLFLDFNTSLLFGNNTQTLGSIASRDFTAKNPANNSKYIAAKHAHLTHQGFFQHLAHLQTLPRGDHALAERLDTNLREASEAAGNKVKRLFHGPWWSLALTKARVSVEILRQQIVGFKTNIDVQPVLMQRISDISSDIILPPTLEECVALLPIQLENLQKMERNSLEIRHDEMAVQATIASDTGDRKTKQWLDPLHSSKAHAAI
jgi:hypothetical protein